MLQFVLGAAGLAVFVLVAWKISSALTRRGVVVRPVSMMDSAMTRIEKQFSGSKPSHPDKL